MAGLVPAIPIVWSATPFFIGITGTRPVMTRRSNFQPSSGCSRKIFAESAMVAPSDKPKSPRPPVPGARILVVEARFYDDIADELLRGAKGAVEAAQASMDVLTLDGALEIPATIAIALDAAERAGRPYDAVVALGCVIRGETGHYDIVAGESARALMDLSVERRIPLANGILTVENDQQAWTRASVNELNKGGGAVDAALAVLRIKKTLEA